jgi:hypothetical protein
VAPFADMWHEPRDYLTILTLGFSSWPIFG